MKSMAFNPASLYSTDLSVASEKASKLSEKTESNSFKAPESKVEKKETPVAARVELSDKAKELKKELASEIAKDLSASSKAEKIHGKKFGNLEKPGIYFVSGFNWFGAGSIKGNYDGIKDMAEAVEGAKHFDWDEQEEIIEDIKKRKSDQPIILVGHSFGGDGVMEIAQTLNTIDNGFRKIDLLVTLDSVGADNDIVPQNVKRNLNFLAQGPYEFLNDGPNIALNYERTDVKNFLRPEEHADLDDATDIQIEILEKIEEALKPA